jgi:hypothetical protein
MSCETKKEVHAQHSSCIERTTGCLLLADLDGVTIAGLTPVAPVSSLLCKSAYYDVQSEDASTVHARVKR